MMKKTSLFFGLVLLAMLIFPTAQASDPPSLIRVFGENGNGEGQFVTPVSISAIDNQLYVSDQVNDRIQVFDYDWNFISEFSSTSGGAAGTLNAPYEVESNGTHIFVPDYNNNRITIHDMSGSYITEFGNTGPAEELVNGPVDLIIGDQIILVSSFVSANIKIYNATSFAYMYTIGQDYGVGNYGNLETSWGIASSDSKLFVADSFNQTIQEFDISTGSFMRYTSIPFPIDVEFVNGYLLAVAEDEQLYIYDDNLNLIDVVSLGDNAVMDTTMFGITNTKFYLANGNFDNIREYKLVADPMNIVALAGKNDISLSWQIQPEMGLTEPSHYEVYRDDNGGLIFLGTSQDRHFVDVTATAGTIYSYRIKAVSIIGESDMISSDAVNVVPTPQQTGISVTTETVTETDTESLPLNMLVFSSTLLVVPLIIRRKK